MTSALLDFIRAVVAGDIDQVSRRLAGDPALATTAADVGATREKASDFFFGAKEAHRRTPANNRPPSSGSCRSAEQD